MFENQSPDFFGYGDWAKFDQNLIEGILRKENKSTFDRKEFIYGKTYDPMKKVWRDRFHKKQREFFELKQNAIIIMTGKRPGKTHMMAANIIIADQTIHPGKKGFILFSTTTLAHAHELIYQELKEWSDEFNLGWDWSQYKKYAVIMTPNKNFIRLVGLHDKESWKKMQGIGIKLWESDESQMIKDGVLRDFDQEICSMGRMEFFDPKTGQGGKMVMAGNPPKRHTGFYWEMWAKAKDPDQQDMVSFSMSVKDNPFFSHEQIDAFFKMERKRLGLKDGQENPAFLRNALGKTVQETNTLIYNIRENNYFDAPPPFQGRMTQILGLDMGYHNKDAISVIRCDLENRLIYTVYEWEKEKQIVSDLAKKAKEVLRQYPCDMKVGDFGGLGLKIQKEFIVNHELFIQVAKKTDKMDWVEKMRDLVARGMLKFRRDSLFVQDAPYIHYDEMFEDIDDSITGADGLRFHSDIHDALLYSVRWAMTEFPKEYDNFEYTPVRQVPKKIMHIPEEDRHLFRNLEGFEKVFGVEEEGPGRTHF